jgi:FtsZ-binding cell division protein ZapB
MKSRPRCRNLVPLSRGMDTILRTEIMNTKLGIDELREAADRAEREAQQAMRERAAAVTRSQEALRAAARARQKYLRASGAQGGGEGSDGG